MTAVKGEPEQLALFETEEEEDDEDEDEDEYCCDSPDHWFDRTICGLCGCMHTYCLNCGDGQDCVFDE
jgi:hypothetical protein